VKSHNFETGDRVKVPGKPGYWVVSALVGDHSVQVSRAGQVMMLEHQKLSHYAADTPLPNEARHTF